MQLLLCWEGPKATYHGNIIQPAVTCRVNTKRDESIPTLAQMTEKTIGLLKGNENGSFWQVEGASIDKQIMLLIHVDRLVKQ